MPSRWSVLQSRRTIGTRDVVTIGIAAASAVAASLLLLPDVRGAAGSGLALLMIAIAVVDARRFIIPDELSAAALGLGLAIVAWQADDMTAALGAAMLRGAVLAFAFWGLRALYRRLRGQDGLGLGDVKLAGVAGVWLDWATIPLAIEIAALSALAVCAVRYFCDRGAVASTTKMPFGLFFAPAIWIAWLLGAALLAGSGLPFFP